MINIIVSNKHFVLYFFSYLYVQSGGSIDFQYCILSQEFLKMMCWSIVEIIESDSEVSRSTNHLDKSESALNSASSA